MYLIWNMQITLCFTRYKKKATFNDLEPRLSKHDIKELGENTGNQHFLVFLHVFYSVLGKNNLISIKSNAFNLNWSKIL